MMKTIFKTTIFSIITVLAIMLGSTVIKIWPNDSQIEDFGGGQRLDANEMSYPAHINKAGHRPLEPESEGKL